MQFNLEQSQLSVENITIQRQMLKPQINTVLSWTFSVLRSTRNLCWSHRTGSSAPRRCVRSFTACRRSISATRCSRSPWRPAWPSGITARRSETCLWPRLVLISACLTFFASDWCVRITGLWPRFSVKVWILQFHRVWSTSPGFSKAVESKQIETLLRLQVNLWGCTGRHM